MIQSIQKVIQIGSSGGVTIPAKELKRQNINIGDEVEVIVRPLHSSSDEDAQVIATARKVIVDFKQDFENLSKR